VIAGAEAVIALSLHLSIVALAFGVPVYRLMPSSPSKYGLLADIPGVHGFGDAPASSPLAIQEGRSTPHPEVQKRTVELQRHWDTIAALAADGQRSVTARQATSFLMQAPLVLQGDAGREADLELRLRDQEHALRDPHTRRTEDDSTQRRLTGALKRFRRRIGPLDVER